MATLSEKRKTYANQESDILDARVVANYGDPGLDEDYHYDILSRYVIVCLESCDRVLTNDKWVRMLAVVKRPEVLWIDVEGDITAQRRSDFQGNVNVGIAANPSIKGISRMNNPYVLGETLKIRRLPEPLKSDNSTIFTSKFATWDPDKIMYSGWHNQGSDLAYFANHSDRIASLESKTIEPTSVAGTYNFFLHKYQYEAFALSINSANQTMVQTLSTIFDGSWGGSSLVYSANGGYFYNGKVFTLMSGILYEDLNLGNKMRVATTDCIPLVVTTPNSFPTPKSRSPGTINYNPTYATIVKGS